jgi:1-acyl-sn-glycerol-3-phosphate acyltransferase
VTSLASHGASFVRLSLWALLTLAAIPVQLVCLGLGQAAANGFPPHYHRLVLRIFGIRLTVRGAIPGPGPLLVVANHISYLDPEIMASLVPATFIAKSEVARWPLFGLLAKLQRSVFIERGRRNAVGDQRDGISGRLKSGDTLVLFPEGTSSDGNRVLAFKTSLFGAALTRIDGKPVTVQPVTLAYVGLNGMPLGRTLRPYVAWYGGMYLADHLWTMAGLGTIDAVVEFHPQVTIDGFTSRKQMAEHCRQVIAAGLEAANTGRARPVQLPAVETNSVEAPLAVPA